MRSVLKLGAALEPLFFDFETDQEYRIYLLGIRDCDRTLQYVCDPVLAAIAARFELQIANAATACKKLISLSAERHRPLACYSSHDATVFGKTCSGCSVRFLDMHKLGKQWINGFHYDDYRAQPSFGRGLRSRGRAIDRWTFLSIAKFAGIKIPYGYAPRGTLRRIRDVGAGLQRTGGKYDGLTGVQKRKYQYLIDHNRFDVEGLQQLFHHIKSELAEEKFLKLLKSSERIATP